MFSLGAAPFAFLWVMQSVVVFFLHSKGAWHRMSGYPEYELIASVLVALFMNKCVSNLPGKLSGGFWVWLWAAPSFAMALIAILSKGVGYFDAADARIADLYVVTVAVGLILLLDTLVSVGKTPPAE